MTLVLASFKILNDFVYTYHFNLNTLYPINPLLTIMSVFFWPPKSLLFSYTKWQNMNSNFFVKLFSKHSFIS